jgi:hypothetical protein
VIAVAIGVCGFVMRASSAMVVFAAIPYYLAFAGGLAGALSFTRHDRMFWAWLSIGVGNLVGGLTAAIVPRPPLHALGGEAASTTVAVLLVVSDVILNVSTVAGLVIFAQAWRALGPRPGWYNAATGIAFAVAAAVVGVPIVNAFRAGDVGWGTIISSFGDLAAFTMIGPLAVTAIRMRGGALVWT